MPETTQEMSSKNSWLRNQGYNWEMIVRNEQRATWYKPDGTVLPNLPADPYHMHRFRAKGWMLIPPHLVAVTPSPNPEPEPVPDPEPEPILAEHTCSFPRPLGSQCKVQGCINTRQMVYRKRRKAVA